MCWVLNYIDRFKLVDDINTLSLSQENPRSIERSTKLPDLTGKIQIKLSELKGPYSDVFPSTYNGVEVILGAMLNEIPY